MGKVLVLDEATSNRIAAGEVVDRPASAVKELIENSLDAGARHIVVQITRGGKTLLKVTDDGEGMDPGDAVLALERHATSKVRSGDTLAGIATMGFRGEALPAVASVSRFVLQTRARGASHGTMVKVTGGTIEASEPSGGPEGTTITVSDLYFNVPARQKFLKADSAETAAVTEVVANAALAWPEVSFKLISGAETRLVTTGDGDRRAVARAVFGRGLDDQVIALPVRAIGRLPVTLEGLITRPQYSMASRRALRVFVNRRPIRSAALSRAVLVAYRNLLPVGKSPLALLFLVAPPEWLDVNVHPAKAEVRFQEPVPLEDGLVRELRRALEGPGQPRDLMGTMPGEMAPGTFDSPAHSIDGATCFAPTLVSDALQEGGRGTENPAPRGDPFTTALQWSAGGTHGAPWPAPSPGLFGTPRPSRLAGAVSLFAPGAASRPSEPSATTPHPCSDGPGDLPGTEAQAADLTAIGRLEILGQLFSTYIVGTDGERLYLIDQHVAHERVLFERHLDRLNRKETSAQRLLIPLTLELSRDSEGLITDRLDLLRHHGFEAEVWSGPSLVVTAVPMLGDRVATRALLESLVGDMERLAPGHSHDEALRGLAATLACRSAVMAGDPMETSAMANLVDDLSRCRHPMTCPHGRPSVLVVSRHDLDRRFLRC